MLIRNVTEKDAAALAEIYRPYVEKTAISFEYDAPDAEEFARRIRNTLKKYPYLAAVDNTESQDDTPGEEKILGYVYAGPFVGRKAYDHSCELSIYVDWNCRRGGVGGALYRRMEKLLKEQGITNLYACIGAPVGEPDEYLDNNSIEFHQHMGFTLVGRFHKCGYKFGRWYDMVWMEKII